MFNPQPDDFQDIKMRLGIHVLSQDTSLSFAASKSSSLGDSQYCTDDSYVSQSFVDHFGTQCLSESGGASPDGGPSYSLHNGAISPIHCSPPCSLPGSSCSSPLSSGGESASGCSGVASPLFGTSSGWSSRSENSGAQRDVPMSPSLLPGIEPLHSEETVGFNPLSTSTGSAKRQRRQSFNQENPGSILCKSTPKRSRQALAIIENVPPTHHNEILHKRRSKKTKRRLN